MSTLAPGAGHTHVARQFVLFLLNGGLIGLGCWALQQALYALVGSPSQWSYWATSLTASGLAIVVNFRMQRRFIFVARDGNFWLFALAATAMTLCVSGAAVGMRQWLTGPLSAADAARWGFVAGALVVAPFSFAVKKLLVFRRVRA